MSVNKTHTVEISFYNNLLTPYSPICFFPKVYFEIPRHHQLFLKLYFYMTYNHLHHSTLYTPQEWTGSNQTYKPKRLFPHIILMCNLNLLFYFELAMPHYPKHARRENPSF